MKVTERTIQNNIFSVEENGEAISIIADQGWIYVTLSEGGRIRKADEFSFIGFKNCLQRLCCDVPLSSPSSGDKIPTAATGEANSGTQEFEVGDRVQFNASEGPNLMVTTQGVINCIFGDGVAQIRAEGWELTTSAPFEGGVSFFFRRIDYERQMKERMESMERLHKGKLEARELLEKIRKEPNHTDQ